MKERILVVEDDPAILTGLADLLESEGYAVETARSGTSALELFRQSSPDLVLLDVMIPGKNGYDVCREIRASDRVTPVVMLTAKGQEIDKVVGLELGADDYVVKPFGIAELLARIRSVLRRSALARLGTPGGDGDILNAAFGNVIVDFGAMTGSRDGVPFSLTPRESSLLLFFLRHEGRVVDRNTLLEELWGISCDVTTRTVDQHVVRLRQKIEDDPAAPVHIQTVHGAGYRFVSRCAPPMDESHS